MSTHELDRLATLGWRVEEHATLDDGVWRLGDERSVSYPAEGFAALAAHTGGSYWFDHRAAEVSAALDRFGATVLWEIGAGSGAMTTRLVQRGYEVVAVEPLLAGAQAIADAGGAVALCGTVDQLDLPDASVPVVGMFDVLEHLPRPREVLHEVRRILAPGGLLVVTVPALRWLWSDEDDAAGHVVRFTRATLSDLVMPAGFDRVQATYLYASLVAPAAAVRALPYRLGRRRDTQHALDALAGQLDPAPAVDVTVRRVLRAESSLSRRLRLPFGTSILGVYQAA